MLRPRRFHRVLNDIVDSIDVLHGLLQRPCIVEMGQLEP